MYKKKRTWNLRDETTIFESMSLYNTCESAFTELHEQQTKCFDFTVGELQWDKDIRQALRDERRPANSYNLIRSILNVIFAVEKENQRQSRANPRTTGDRELATTLTQVLRYYMYHAKFRKAQKKATMDAVVAIFGVYGVNWVYSNDNPEGQLEIDACDPRQFMFEPNYNDPLWTKSNYLFRKHQLSLEEILNHFALNDDEMQNEILTEAKEFFEKDSDKRDKWVGKKLKALFSAVYETTTGIDTSSSNLFKNYLQWWDPSTGKFDVLELHEKRTERRVIIPNNEGTKLIDLTDVVRKEDGINFDNEKIDQIKKSYGLTGDAKADLKNMRFVTATVPAFILKVNEQPYPFESDYYVYIPQNCYNLHADPLKAQSVVTDLIDPQAHFNKAQSLKLELLGRYANKGWILDENAIEGLEEDWSSNRIAPFKRVRAGYINMIKPEEGQTISPDLVRDPMETQSLMNVISNANDEMKGQDNSQVKSGKHFLAKERQQSKSFSYIFDNRDDTQIAVAELSINFIQHFVTQQKIIRITQDVKVPEDLTVNQSVFGIDEAGRISEQIVNDLDSVKVDIELSDEPYSSSAREERYAKLGDIFNATAEINPEKANALLPILVEEGMPEIADKVIEAWDKIGTPTPEQQQQQQQMTQMAQMMQQLQMVMAKLGVEEKKVEIAGKKLDNLETVQEIKQTAKGKKEKVSTNYKQSEKTL